MRLQDVRDAFSSSYGATVNLVDVFGEDSDYDVGRALAAEFIQKTGLDNMPQVIFLKSQHSSALLSGNSIYLKNYVEASVQRNLRPRLLYIIRKLFLRPIIAGHKIYILLKGHFTIYKKKPTNQQPKKKIFPMVDSNIGLSFC